MNSLARMWLRRIAFGLPLASAALPLTGCPFGCPPPEISERTYTITAEQRAMLNVDGSNADGGVSCSALCNMLQTDYLGYVSSCDVDDSGAAPSLHCTFETECIGGRRPSGLLEARALGSHAPVAAFLARCARLEEASIPAFLDLAHELELHGAPRALVEGARRAAADEARHAREIGALARRFGASPAAVTRTETQPRTMREIADDNAVEGCAREAYAALLAARQSISAPDARVARTYARIARDEARHALWSFALHTWSASAMPAAHARAADARRRESITELAAALEHEAAPELRDTLGVPDAERAVEMARALL